MADQCEDCKQELALQRDSQEPLAKEIWMMSAQFREGMGLMNSFMQNMKEIMLAKPGTSQHVVSSNYVTNNNNESSSSNERLKPETAMTASNMRSRQCFMCDEQGHFVVDCPHYKEFMKLGWMVPEGNGLMRMKLKNNTKLPWKEPNGPPRYVLI